MDSWASRETSASFDFFDRLVLWVTGTFLIEVLGAFGDFTTGSVSWIGGSTTIVSSAEGAVAASLFGSSSSLKSKGNRVYTTRKDENKYKKHRDRRTFTMP
jgi:hypothetical protein